MDIEKDIGTDLKVDVKIVAGKVILSIEFDGADAALDSLKPKLPAWLAPIMDLAKGYIDGAS